MWVVASTEEMSVHMRAASSWGRDAGADRRHSADARGDCEAPKEHRVMSRSRDVRSGAEREGDERREGEGEGEERGRREEGETGVNKGGNMCTPRSQQCRCWLPSGVSSVMR